MKQILSFSLLVIFSLTLGLSNAGDKSGENTKKLNTKKIFREEQKIVLGWGSIYGKLYAKKKRMKKKFQ